MWLCPFYIQPLELHVRTVNDMHRVEPHPLARQHLASLPGLLGEGLVDGRDVQGGQRRVDGAYVVVTQVRDHAPERVRDPGAGGDDHPGNAELPGELRGVQRAGAAEGEQREVARVVTSRQRHHAKRSRHAVVGDAKDRCRGILRIQPERRTNLFVESHRDRIERDRTVHREQRVRVEPPEQQVGVGDRHPLSAAPEADGTRRGARALRSHLQESRFVDEGDGAAAGADGVHVHHRDVDGHRVLHLELRTHRRYPAPNESDVAARAAHVVRDHVLEAGAGGRVRGGHHPRGRTGHDRCDRGIHRHPRGDGAAVASHHQHVALVGAGFELVDEAREVVGEDRLHAGVDRGGGAAFVFAELGEDLVAGGDVVVGPQRLHDPKDR